MPFPDHAPPIGRCALSMSRRSRDNRQRECAEPSYARETGVAAAPSCPHSIVLDPPCCDTASSTGSRRTFVNFFVHHRACHIRDRGARLSHPIDANAPLLRGPGSMLPGPLAPEGCAGPVGRTGCRRGSALLPTSPSCPMHITALLCDASADPKIFGLSWYYVDLQELMS